MFAYRVTVQGLRGVEAIYPGKTRGQAISLAIMDSLDACAFRFIDFRARRAPEFDDLAQQTDGKIGWCLGYRRSNEAWGCLGDDAGAEASDTDK